MRSTDSRPRRGRRWSGLMLTATTVIAVGCGTTSGPATTIPSASSGPTAATATPAGSAGSASPSAAVSPAARSFDPGRVAVSLEPYADGLSAPLAISNAGDGSGRLFVAEQGGRIRIVRNGRVEATPFLDISDEITTGGERGLLGVAFHPRFPEDPRVFVDYTDGNGDTQVSSFTVDAADPDRLDPASETRILGVKQPFANHNGGALVFDPQGFLLISLGDGGSGGDPQGNGQSLTTLLGKILRIDVDGTTADAPYRIPADNPYAVGAGGRRPEIWLTGLRNPWRIAIDRATGDLWIGDVGQNAWEEVDVQRAGAPGGTNFGWNRMEGSHCYQPAEGCEDASLSQPVTDYGHDLGCTVIGGGVYRGSAQAALVGGYVFGDYCSGRIWAIDPATDGYRAP
ncbi:MAG TPA: PQQ-dependent sugar dehydrogenase, partial [Candidatus Deferrimicrobium sp.]|nr:PQQ-dependent sugar dehydrogenase [Candidatus Deferrimicrobium sp.]